MACTTADHRQADQTQELLRLVHSGRPACGLRPGEAPAGAPAEPSGRLPAPPLSRCAMRCATAGSSFFTSLSGVTEMTTGFLVIRIVHRNRRRRCVYRLDGPGKIAEASADNFLRLERRAVCTS